MAEMIPPSFINLTKKVRALEISLAYWQHWKP
jgi:hypothetical protein